MSFLKKLFGGKKEPDNEIEDLVKDTLEGIIERGGFEMTYEVTTKKDERGETTLAVELFGQDEELLKEKKGMMLDSLQLLIKRVVQHRFPEDRTNVSVDCGGVVAGDVSHTRLWRPATQGLHANPRRPARLDLVRAEQSGSVPVAVVGG